MRPTFIKGGTARLDTPCGHLYATFNGETRLCELFLNLGKAGGCVGAHMEALGRVISIAIQDGVDPQKFADTLKGINCHQSNSDVLSCLNMFAHQLDEQVKMRSEVKKVE